MKKSRVVVKVKGLNQERALNSIVKSMNIYNLKRKSHNLAKFEVDFDKKKQLYKLLKENNLEVVDVSYQGLKWKMKRILTSYGLIAGIILCSILYFFQYGFIWNIKVVGEENLKEKEIVSFVQEKMGGRRKSKINEKSIEKELIDNFDEISSASVAIVGQSLIININESIIPEEMQTANSPIISEFDGIITDIKLVQGTLAVDVGDIVQKGDLLVYPYMIDSQGEEREVFPKAEIWADVWINQKEVCYDYQIKSERTGESLTINQIYLWNLLIYSNEKECLFEQYEKDITSDYLNKNNILPFIKKKITYYEVKTKEYFLDFAQEKENIIEKLRQKTLIFLYENEIIKEEKYFLKEGGGVHEINYIITVNRNLGSTYEN